MRPIMEDKPKKEEPIPPTQSKEGVDTLSFQGHSQPASAASPCNPPGCHGPTLRPQGGEWVKKWPVDGQPYYEQVILYSAPTSLIA